MASENKSNAAESCHKPLDYNKWNDLDFSSDEDDCHPNIEINTWRRMKERMRKEKGIVKREPILIDKWNKTSVNQKHVIDVTKKPDTSDNLQQQTQENDSKNTQDKQEEEEEEQQQQEQQQQQSPSVSHKTTTNNSPKKKDSESKDDEKSKEPKSKPSDEFVARSDPQVFLDENLDSLRKFVKMKSDESADRYLQKNGELVHEAAEGYCITHAVDRAVEGADAKELQRLARRCLTIHNLVLSCTQANLSPDKGVEMFYKRLANPMVASQYKVELEKQVEELMQRIMTRKKERLAEMVNNEYEEVPAPLGPGGLDPTEVLNSLPEDMQQAFIDQDVPKLREILSVMAEEEAEYHMKRCVDAGLWVTGEE